MKLYFKRTNKKEKFWESKEFNDAWDLSKYITDLLLKTNTKSLTIKIVKTK